MNPAQELAQQLTRRAFLQQTVAGTAALSALLNESTALAAARTLAPKAQRIIYLFQAGGLSQFESFDYKPKLAALRGTNLPDSVRRGQRLTGMSAHQTSLPVASSLFKFAQHGQSGAWVSELFPHTARIVDELAFVKSLHTEQINHDPAQTFALTGFQLAGRPSLGAWLSYGLGSENKDLPAFITMISVSKRGGDQPLYERLWGSGFLPAQFQGVKFHNGADPVLFLSNPQGITQAARRQFLDDLAELNQQNAKRFQDPEIAARTAQYELAFRMQTSVPELTDLSKEPERVVARYGPEARKPGAFAANCLLARRLSERGVRFIQLFHRGWDHHGGLPGAMPVLAGEVDQPAAALIQDLKERGLLDTTLVIFGSEFGRTVYSQGTLTDKDYGRDHHPRCFTVWLAGGGVKAGTSLGETDDFSYNIVREPVHLHDFNATLLHLLGINHEKLTYRYQGRDFRLTDVHGIVQEKLLA
jgi:uncharacterized protein (DUF1501 family)